MNHFYCEICHTLISREPPTECIHYPLDEAHILSPNFKGRIRHDKLQEIRKESGEGIKKLFKNLTGLDL